MRQLLVILTLLLAVPALADDDHDRAREALARGEILPLSKILAVVEREVGGRVIEIDFDRDDGRYVYDVEAVSSDGRLVELKIDAASGAVLERDYEDD
ncbi:PepSY domain-containing protein [Aquamicrobium terrae]|uniref:Membrane protein YkoI n=1 Tax=Aquamicrobium terrae TaxID=1324945 RepID=A0ABV2MZS8_9HYPH